MYLNNFIFKNNLVEIVDLGMPLLAFDTLFLDTVLPFLEPCSSLSMFYLDLFSLYIVYY